MGQTTDIRDTFFQECEELLETLGDGLRLIEAELSEGSAEVETVNAVFRAVHSIKGGAGAFELKQLVKFAHQFETALDGLRSGRLFADHEVLELFHCAEDHLADLVAAARDGDELQAESGSVLVEKLAGLTGQSVESVPDDATAADFGFEPMAISFDLEDDLDQREGGEDAKGGYLIHFAPSNQLYALGHDPAVLFRVLGELGVAEVSVDANRLPDFDQFDWQESYLDWTVSIRTDEPEHVIHEVFEFVEGLCELNIAPTMRDDTRAITKLAECVFEITARAAPPDLSVMMQAAQTAAANKDIRIDLADPRKAATPPRATVRVELDRVDRLINVVGELVINQAMLSQCIQAAGISPRSDIGTGLDEFRNLAREIQESVMAIRAQPIKPLFQRMSRIVREASTTSGRSVRLMTEGELTEVDKTVIERLADPLTHMIRNAVDHGIEGAAQRLASGKPEIGVITLSAAHRSGRVLIEISDDGSGINRSRVREIAFNKGLISGEVDLTDAEIDNLLFLPGFSTATEISNLSGRGVGMDVVKSAIQSLGGRVTIHSVPGQGTTFSISLPLTLAILEGMVVDIAGQTMVIPITTIVETIRPLVAEIHNLGSEGQVVSHRGGFVPIVDLGVVFGYRGSEKDFRDTVLLLVETDQGGQFALAVDAIQDQRQVVIKGLDDNYGHIPGVAAATILGDGNIALIIDPEEAVQVMACVAAQPPAQNLEVHDGTTG